MISTSPRASLAGIAAFYKRVQIAAVVLGALWLLWLLSPVLVPFAVALLLAWIGDPFVDRLQARGASRNTAVLAVFLMMLLLVVFTLLVLVPTIQKQILVLIAAFPRYRAWFESTLLPGIEARLGLNIREWLDAEQLMGWLREHWKQAGGFATTLIGYVSRSGFMMLGWIANLVLIPILTFFFLRDWDTMVARAELLVPRDHFPLVDRIARESSDVLRAFLRGQLLVMIILGVMYAIGLRLVGLELGILIGLVAGLCSFVPYLGPAALLLLGSAAALAQFGDWQHLVGVAVVFTVGQLIESYWLTPKLVGKNIGLSEVTVIFAVMAGGQLFGFLGMLLALPVAAVANVLLRHAREGYVASRFYRGDAPASAGIIVPDSLGDVLEGGVDIPE